jgi:hypothetical protein
MKKLISLILLGLFSGFALSYLADFGSNTKMAIRNPAAEIWQGKHQRAFEVQIHSKQGLSPEDDQDLVLLGKITPMGALGTEVFYKWILPEGASVVDGELEDSLVGLKPGQLLEKEITLHSMSLDGENKIVVLQVWTNIDGVKIGGAGVFATKPDEVQVSETPDQLRSKAVETRELPDFIHQ